jgi:hypothetical protein
MRVKVAATSSLPRQQAMLLSLPSRQPMGRGSEKEKRGETPKPYEEKKEKRRKISESSIKS